MPSMSGWVLRGRHRSPRGRLQVRFYALDVGLGVARYVTTPGVLKEYSSFYALDVGLGVARDAGFLGEFKEF